MASPISSQLRQALAAFCLGLLLGAVYDVLRVLRRRFPSRLLTALCDLVYAFFCCLCLFAVGFTQGGGRVRVFVTVFALLSAALYFYTVGPFFLRLTEGLFALLGRVFRPAALFFRSIKKKICFFSKNLFSSGKKEYRMIFV